MANSYQVFVDDNYHYQDEDERYKLGDFSTFEEALIACQAIVDEYLQGSWKEGITAEELYENYVGFGEDPFIIGEPAPFRFSAWNYAKERCLQICSES
jgi:hypothetical protein